MKTHLLDSSDPIIEGQPQMTLCATLLPHAGFVQQIDDARAESVINSVSCYRCKKMAGMLFRKYLYIVANGEEMKQREAGI